MMGQDMMLIRMKMLLAMLATIKVVVFQTLWVMMLNFVMWPMGRLIHYDDDPIIGVMRTTIFNTIIINLCIAFMAYGGVIMYDMSVYRSLIYMFIHAYLLAHVFPWASATLFQDRKGNPQRLC